MDIRTLHYFLVIAQQKSISAASEILYVTQPTLSRQMMELEKELGVRLFYRGSKGKKMILTEEGRLLKKRAEEILILVEKTEKELQHTSESLHGDLYIGAGETPAFEIIARVCSLFSETYPQVRIHLFSANADAILEKMESGVVDFGLLIGNPDIGSYEFLPVPVQDQWGIMVSRSVWDSDCTSITRQQLEQMPLIVSDQINSSKSFSGWFGRDMESLHIVCRYNLAYNAAFLAASGQGAMLTLKGLIPSVLYNRVRFVPLDPPMYAHLSLVWPSTRELSRPAAVFLEYLRNELQQSDPD